MSKELAALTGMEPADGVANVQRGAVADYVALLKPRVMSLVIFTSVVGLVVAPGELHWFLGFVAVLCISIGAGASGALNMWYEADIDALMKRTENRPIPAGRMVPGDALGFGVSLAVGSVIIMGLLINVTAAALLAFTILFYACIYTIWLKRRTPQNIVIGGAAGAFPPVIGWVAVTGSLTWEPMLLFAIIFLWTPPHFWALALTREGDYEKAGVPMMPNVAGVASTKRQILVYSLLLAPIGVAPWWVGMAGIYYGLTAAVLGIGFVWQAICVYRGKPARAAERLFGYSLIYLFLLFATMLGEHLLGLAP